MLRVYVLILFAITASAAAAEVDYTARIQPLLTKYCAGCHNDDDREGKLSLASYDSLLKGGAKGAVVTAGHGELSRLVRVLNGKAEPAMPPKDNEKPTAAEIELLVEWINAGAKGPTGAAPDPMLLVTPQIPLKAPQRQYVSAAAVNPQGTVVALARFGEVELRAHPEGKTLHKLSGLRGSVNGVAFSADGARVAAAAGEPGLQGEVRIWNVADGALIRTLKGHKDSVYSARFSPNGETLATGGYDHDVKLWDLKTGDVKKTLVGHNGPVFELAFRHDGKVLASAGGDRTVKLWDVATGERLETLKESLKELYTLAFHPDGDRLAAAGVDNRIRVWKISADAKEGTNPLLLSQFAHEAAVLRLMWSRDGKTLVSSGEEKLVKVWNADGMTIRSTLERQPDWVLGLSLTPKAEQVIVGRLDGSVATYPVPPPVAENSLPLVAAPETPPVIDYGPQPKLSEIAKTAEVEPNNAPEQATRLSPPAVAVGRIFADGAADYDLYRFAAKAGDQWIVETNAARAGSPLDSKVEVLDLAGRPIPKLLLRAVRDTELEFRGGNSEQRGFRVKNWEEMLLNEYIYVNGDVMKLFQQRRGPDADGQFYPENGNRQAFFETTARAHALGEPGYMVVPYPVGTQLPDNGLPVFTLNFENDDEGLRRLGKDSRVTFIAPADGEYLVRVSDVRGFHGDKYSYELVIRRPQPDFKVTLNGANPTVQAGSGKPFSVKADRMDHFQGPIRVDLANVPAGWSVTTPIVIAEGLYEAQGVLNASPGATAHGEDVWKQVVVHATSMIAGKEVVRDVNNLGTVKLEPRPKLVAHLELSGSPIPPSQPERKWVVLEPKTATSSGGAVLTKQADHSLLAGGTNPDQDVYTITLPTDLRGIRAVRLETLGDASLPAAAPGRATPNGNFVLTEVKVAASPASDPARSEPMVFAAATADYSQPSFDPKFVLDGVAKTGWAIAINDAAKGYPVMKTGNDPSHRLILEAKEPLAGFDGGTVLTVTLEHGGDNKQHNLGRFRIAVTTDPIPSPVTTFPQPAELTLKPGESVTCRLRVERRGFEGRVQFDVQNLPHGVIVDDIGLNGILIVEGQTERTMFLRAEPWVKPQSRLFHANAQVEGNQVSLPMWLHIK